MLEAALKKDNTFVTLTYSDEELPRLGDGRGNLKKKDMQDFMKRFRKEISPLKIRFFGVGEYGDNTERPHYHLAVFGYPNCRFGQSTYHPARGITRISCCVACDTVKRAWGKGDVFLAPLEPASAGYVAGYTTKKMTGRDDERLQGREPEFARMSNRPGIGADFMHEVASSLMEFNLVPENGEADVPSALRHGSRVLPLGRYLKRRLRKYVGLPEETPQVVLDQIDAEMQPVREAAEANAKGLSYGSYGKEFKRLLFELGEGAAINMSSKVKSRKGRF